MKVLKIIIAGQKITCRKKWLIKKISTHQWKCLKGTVWRSNNHYPKNFFSVMNKETLKNITFLNVNKITIHQNLNWLKLKVKILLILTFLKSIFKKLSLISKVTQLKMIKFQKNLGKNFQNLTEKRNSLSKKIVKTKTYSLITLVKFRLIDTYLQNKFRLKSQAFFSNVSKFWNKD